MGLFFPVRQVTLHIPNTGPRGQGHLFVILTNRCAAGQHLLVPICSERPGCDRTCLLGAGDHKFIRKSSYVDYGLADIYAADILIKRVEEGVFSYEGLMSSVAFAHIDAGIMQSGHMTPRMKKYYQINS